MSVNHPIFARIYDKMSVGMEKAGAAEHRDRLLADLLGRMVEVCAGTGLNFAHYPMTVTEIVAIEPEPFLRGRAEIAVGQTTITVHVLDGNDLEAKDRSGLVAALVPWSGGAVLRRSGTHR